MYKTIQNPKTDWAPFENEIQYLYSEKDWGLERVRQYMTDRHNLKATKKQYKLLLRRICGKKNLRKNEWYSIISGIRGRQLAGKQTQVLFKGIPLEEARIERASQRYHIEEGSVEIPALSRDLVLRTPPPRMRALLEPVEQIATWNNTEPPNKTGKAYWSGHYGLDVPWEPLDIPPDAMSNVDLGNIANDPRLIWLYDLPSWHMQKALCLPREYQMEEREDLEYGREVGNHPPSQKTCSTLHRWPNHCWSWDALRSILKSVEQLCFVRSRYFGPSDQNDIFDLTLCTKTELLGIVISISINYLSSLSNVGAWDPRWIRKLWRWLVLRQHHGLLFAIFHGHLDAGNETIFAFAQVFLVTLSDFFDGRYCGDSFENQRDIPRCDRGEAARVVLTALQSSGRGLADFLTTRLLGNAIHWKSSGMAEALIDHGADCNGLGSSSSGLIPIFDEALKSEQVDIINMLLQHGAKPAIHLGTARFSQSSQQEHFSRENIDPQAIVSRDMDLDIDETLYKNLTIFTHTQFCILRAPSLSRFLTTCSKELEGGCLSTILFAAAEGRKSSLDTQILLREVTLFGAAEFRNPKLVHCLLQSGVNPSCPTAEKYVENFMVSRKSADEPHVPIEHAVRNADTAIAALLLDAGAHVTQRMFEFLPPISEKETIDFLRIITQKLDHSEAKTHGLLFLFPEIHDGNKEMIDQILSSGVDINGRITCRKFDEHQMEAKITVTPLLYALQHCSHDIVEYLWMKGARFLEPPPFAGSMELSIIGKFLVNDMLEKLDFVFQKGAWPDQPCLLLEWVVVESRGRTPLQWLLGTRESDPPSEEMKSYIIPAVKLFLSYGTDINCRLSRGLTPLQRACDAEDFALVQLLLQEGADANDAGSEWWAPVPRGPLELAIRRDNTAIAHLLMECGASATQEALQHACRQGKRAMVQLLIDKGADVNLPHSYGGTPLTAACRYGQMHVVELLVDLGADIHRGVNGLTPLQSASASSNSALVKYLIDRGADVNEPPQSDGLTALQYGVLHGVIEACLLLLEAGAQVDTPSGKEYWMARGKPLTAIEIAARCGRVDLVKILIYAGAEKHVKKNRFKRAIQLAKSGQCFLAVNILREHAGFAS